MIRLGNVAVRFKTQTRLPSSPNHDTSAQTPPTRRGGKDGGEANTNGGAGGGRNGSAAGVRLRHGVDPAECVPSEGGGRGGGGGMNGGGLGNGSRGYGWTLGSHPSPEGAQRNVRNTSLFSADARFQTSRAGSDSLVERQTCVTHRSIGL
eukprot:scaffold51686_cov68-Phaeocystis_antarctica.AAC.4